MMNDYYKKWCCVIVFDKPFSAGESLDIYKANLEGIIVNASTLGCSCHIYSDSDIEGLMKISAGLSDVEAVTAAFRNAFDADYRKVVLLNPYYSITLPMLEQGFSAMKMIEFCIGPLTSGGYYMLGMNYFEPLLFADADQKIFYDTKKMIRNIGQLRHMLYKLPVLSDKPDLALK